MSNKMISSNKGIIGENQVIEWFTEYYPLSGLDVTAKKGNKGDMILKKPKNISQNNNNNSYFKIFNKFLCSY